ncbi:hypothetical protein N431DRAFT_472574 [Stipitochalara longipes BDJ]|nr:hypothetical protein N431DRAFT_472574 [Stipitochalara longipes BDJ]
MDPEHNSAEGSEDEDANAMAAFMGFSAFGSQKPPAKKRKFNATIDAFVEGQELAKLNRGGKKGSGSGGNNVPLGKMRVLGEKRGNEDEIRLDLDEEDGEEDGPRYMDTSLPPPIEAKLRGRHGGDLEEEEGPRYVDTSLPAPVDVERERGGDKGPAYVDTSEVSPEEAAEMQARIDAILASIGSESNPTVDDDATTEASTLPPPPPGLPQRPAFMATSDTEFMQGASRGRALSDATSSSSRGGRGRGRGGGGGRERGEHNEKWYEGYYDPTFNENPWAKLEKEKGLPSVGTWLENQPRRGGRGMA